jgi:hypothetical protein
MSTSPSMSIRVRKCLRAITRLQEAISCNVGTRPL